MKPGTVFLRDLDPSDPVWEVFGRNYPHFREWFSKVSAGGRKAWVCGNLDAICIFKLERDPDINDWGERLQGKTLKLCSFYVKPEFRGRGLAKKLLSTAFNFARGENCRSIYIHSNNPSIQGFFRKHGFLNAGNYTIEGRVRDCLDLVQVKLLR